MSNLHTIRVLANDDEHTKIEVLITVVKDNGIEGRGPGSDADERDQARFQAEHLTGKVMLMLHDDKNVPGNLATLKVSR